MPKAGFFQRLEQTILRRYASWLDRRVPPRSEITLVQNNIFIYPNVQFIYFFVAVMVLWMAATNYENNLAFGLSFLLLSVFVVCIHHTYNNLAGITLRVLGATPVFLDEYSEVELLLSSQRPRFRESLRLFWHPEQAVVNTFFGGGQGHRVSVSVRANRRGFFKPTRLTVDTVYPLGIIRAVSYLDLDVKILVYPKPVCYSPWQSTAGKGEDGETLVAQRGNDEFSHLQEYQPGASLQRVAWKQFAKGRGMQVKEYGEYVSQQLWLDWDEFPSLEMEARLSNLCYWALQLDQRGEHYGLRLPVVIITPDSGELHLKKILTALALYGDPPLTKGEAHQRMGI